MKMQPRAPTKHKIFEVVAIARHGKINQGHSVWVKIAKQSMRGVSLYSIVNPKNGEVIGSIDAQNLKNRFRSVTTPTKEAPTNNREDS